MPNRVDSVLNPAELRGRYERFRTHYADHGEAGPYLVTFVDTRTSGHPV
jgi:hypothetical protein